jgi:hypothetical protein
MRRGGAGVRRGDAAVARRGGAGVRHGDVAVVRRGGAGERDGVVDAAVAGGAAVRCGLRCGRRAASDDQRCAPAGSSCWGELPWSCTRRRGGGEVRILGP